MTSRRVLRGGLAILAAAQAWVGVCALVAPRSFFDDFPAFGRTWVALLPPYNDHLVRDVGAFSLALTFMLVSAMLTMDRMLVRVSLLALAVFALPHTIYHLTHLAGFPAVDAVAHRFSSTGWCGCLFVHRFECVCWWCRWRVVVSFHGG